MNILCFENEKKKYLLQFFMILLCFFFNGKFIPSTTFINFINLFNKLMHSSGHLLMLQDDFNMIVVKETLFIKGALSSTHAQNELSVSVSVHCHTWLSLCARDELPAGTCLDLSSRRGPSGYDSDF